MTRLILIRHGETLANIEQRYQGQGNSNLSELGIQEAGELAEALKSVKFASIYSSDLIRSSNTAKIIAEKHNLNPIIIPDLKERYYGKWESLSYLEIKKNSPELYENWLKNPAETIIPEAETLEELQIRGIKAVKKIIAKHKDQTICIVGHGGINRVILFHYMNLDLNNFWRIKQDNCCVNIVHFAKHPTVMLLNSTWFLGEKRIKKAVYNHY